MGIEINDVYQFYLDPKEKTIFEGWGKILDEAEPHETYLDDNNDMYQLFRVKVQFLLHSELNGNKPGPLNDKFQTKPFITYRKISVLLQRNADDVDVKSLSYTPKNKKNEIK